MFQICVCKFYITCTVCNPLKNRIIGNNLIHLGHGQLLEFGLVCFGLVDHSSLQKYLNGQ